MRANLVVQKVAAWMVEHPAVALGLMALVLFALIAFLFGGCAAPADSQPGTVMETWAWTAPTTGSPVVGYVWEREITRAGVISMEGDILVTPDTTLTIPQIDEATVRLRVAGYDDRGRQGPFSEWSEYFTEPGLPGQPGQPRRVL